MQADFKAKGIKVIYRIPLLLIGEGDPSTDGSDEVSLRFSFSASFPLHYAPLDSSVEGRTRSRVSLCKILLKDDYPCLFAFALCYASFFIRIFCKAPQRGQFF